jgi:hypothetical protein
MGNLMPYTYNTPTEYAEEEVKKVIDESIAARLEYVQRRLAAYQTSCAAFEQRYGMSTQEFFEQFEAGTLGDQPQWFDWYAAAEGKKIWSRKRDILVHLL